MKSNMLLAFLLSFILLVSLPVWGDSTNDDNDQIKLAVIPKLQVGIHQQQQIITMDKQTQQHQQLQIQQLPMGQMYPSIQLTPRHFLQCLKMYVALVLVVPCLLWVLAYLRASM